ncbi:MAG: single-stranded DNA-binding protein [Carboxylicivirga sp.]|jgi:single-strand DNA-binding protein|nr:single-stranded DNA-binding protein [Carboxylicivirga sp.]
MLKLILSGTLGKDAEVKELGHSKVIKFDVAVTMDYKNSEGKKIEKTEWVRATMWRNEQQNTKVAEYLKQGKKVLIEGVPSSEGFKNKEGDIKSALNVNVKNIEFLN